MSGKLQQQPTTNNQQLTGQPGLEELLHTVSIHDVSVKTLSMTRVSQTSYPPNSMPIPPIIDRDRKLHGRTSFVEHLSLNHMHNGKREMPMAVQSSAETRQLTQVPSDATSKGSINHEDLNVVRSQ